MFRNRKIGTKIERNITIENIITIERSRKNRIKRITEIKFESIAKMDKPKFNNNEYSKAVQEITSSGSWTNFYRNATDHKGNKIGDHELKSLKLRVTNE